MSVTAWIAGEVVDPGRGGIALDDHGLTVGDGCFETVAVVQGEPFALGRHLARLERSCAALALAPPDRAEVRAACRQVLAARVGVGCLRIVVTAGRGPLGSGRSDGATTTLTVLGGAAPAHLGPAAVVTVPWPRNERSALAGVKTTSYAENVVALAWARERGADEALFCNTRGEVCEGSGSNVVIATGDAFVTPPLSSGCLAGITRQLLLEAGAVVERAVRSADVGAMALTSVTRGVQPVRSLDGRALDPGATAPLVEVWDAVLEGSLDP